MINFIKAIHSIIWLVMTLSVVYVGYSVIVMTFDKPFYVSLFLISSEIVVIVSNSWRCPLTGIARRYSDDSAPNFDIFLPRIIAQYNKEIFGTILLIILAIFVMNSLK